MGLVEEVEKVVFFFFSSGFKYVGGCTEGKKKQRELGLRDLTKMELDSQSTFAFLPF